MIAVLDTETTGKERATDQIVELCVQLTGSFGARRVHTWRIKPSIPIHPEAERAHGITAAALADCMSFRQLADSIRSVLAEAEVIVGYNLRFDLDMIQAELARAGREALDLSHVHLVDPLRLWQHEEPRTLTAAVQRFCGASHDGAHHAVADVEATDRVLVGMRTAFGLDALSWPELALRADPMPERFSWLGPSSHLQWKDGDVVLSFGKHKETPLTKVPADYVRWIGSNGFPRHVQDIAVQAKSLPREAFLAWCRLRWPEPVASRQAEPMEVAS